MLSTLLVLVLAGMGFTPGGSVQAAILPAYETLPVLDAGVRNPAAVAVDTQGRIYVAETKMNQVRIFSQGGVLVGQIQGLAAPKSVAVDDAGNIYVGCLGQGGQGYVTVLDSSRSFSHKLEGVFTNPTDIDIAGGQVYVTDNGYGISASGGVWVYNAAGERMNFTSIPAIADSQNVAGEIWHPRSIAIDPVSSEVVILDMKLIPDKYNRNALTDVPRIQFFTMDGTFLRSYDKFGYNLSVGELNSARQLGVDAASRIFVTDSAHNKVLVYDNANTFLGTMDNSKNPLRTPGGLSMSATGRLYVASLERVEVFGIENYSSMGVQPAILNFTATEGSDAPALQDASVVNSGKSAITWTAATATEWVSLPATGGTLDPAAAGTVPVAVNHDGLAPGTYQGSVKVTTPGMEEMVTVNLKVNPNPLQVNPASLSFAAAEGSTPTAQVVNISNGGSEPLSWSAAEDQSWLTLSKNAGTAPNSLKVYANTTGLTNGTYNGTITFTNLAGGKNVLVAVNLNIGGASAPPSDTPALPLPGQGGVKAGGKNWSVTQPAAGIALRGVWGSATRNLLAVGDGGTILSYNGREWKAISSGTTSALQSVWGSVTDSGSDLYTVGDGGLVLHSSGRGWSPIATNTTENLADIWGVNAEVMAAGSNGTILDLTQSTSKNEAVALRSIWAGSTADVFAVGESGAVLHSDGSTWTTMTSDTTEWLNAVWGYPQSGDVFAVGENGAIIHYDGTTWNAMTSGVSVALHGIYGTTADNLYAVGDSGVVLHYDGAAWSVLLAGGVNLRDVWVDDRQVVAVGDDGLILAGMSSSPRKGSRGSMNQTLLTPTLKGPETR